MNLMKIKKKRLLIILGILVGLVIILINQLQYKTNSIIYGNEKAPVKIVEYSNFECEDCYHLHKNIENYLRYYIENNLVQYELKHINISSFYRGEYIYKNMKKLDDIEVLFRVYRTYYQWKDCNEDEINKILKIKKIKFFKRKELLMNNKEVIENHIISVPVLYINEKKYIGVISEDIFRDIIESELKN